MVIDVDDREALEAAQPGALSAVAFEKDGRVIGTVDAQGGADAGGSGKLAIDGRNAVGGDQVGALADLLEKHAHGQHAAHGIPVGPGVGADQEPLAIADDLRMASMGFGWRDSATTLAVSGLATVRRESSMRGYSTGAFCRLRERSMSLFDARLEAAGAVGEKGEIGDVADAHALF